MGSIRVRRFAHFLRHNVMVAVVCGHCGHSVEMHPAVLEREFAKRRWNPHFDVARRRLRCRKCSRIAPDFYAGSAIE